MNLEQQRGRYQNQVEQALKRASANYFQPGSTVSQAAEYALLNGGKRVRGVLCLASCQLLGGKAEQAEDFAAAIEMVHAFSLVHDDLPCMDDDDLRRGKPATHIAFGEDTALLAGDLLALQAFEVISGSPGMDAGQLVQAVQVLAGAAGAKGMIYGQELDLYYESVTVDEQALMQVHRHKTGALISAAAALGAIAAGRKPEQETALATYAANIGLVFQIVDDLLDVTASQEQLGKPIGSDTQQGKSTFVSMFGQHKARLEINRLTDDAVSVIENAYGASADFLSGYAKNLADRVY